MCVSTKKNFSLALSLLLLWTEILFIYYFKDSFISHLVKATTRTGGTTTPGRSERVCESGPPCQCPSELGLSPLPLVGSRRPIVLVTGSERGGRREVTGDFLSCAGEQMDGPYILGLRCPLRQREVLNARAKLRKNLTKGEPREVLSDGVGTLSSNKVYAYRLPGSW